jgi:D-sedoheptulose 7-phosphate isomerase
MSNDRVTTDYLENLYQVAQLFLPNSVQLLLQELERVEFESTKIFLCGNGGSGANALHIENDISVGINKFSGRRLSVETLGSNIAVSGAISNDYSYEEVFSRQLALKSRPGDLLIAFSGSGNSPNILKVLEEAKKIGVRTCAVLGFNGGAAKTLADVPIHFPIDDMQISEDLQLILGHLVLRQFESKG